MNLKSMKLLSLLLVFTIIISGCSEVSDDLDLNIKEQSVIEQPQSESTEIEEPASEELDTPVVEEPESPIVEEPSSNGFDSSGYTEVSSDSCSLSGGRVANAKVDIGYDSDYANRDYYAYTNEFGQLVHVEAAEIILQNDDQEIGGDDRYCSDEAKVPGVEESDLDEGHVIADSLGGASNAYNITPQGSYLNRHGMQAEIEGEIRDAGGATNFNATIEYPDSNTQIPSSYTLSYEINGNLQTHTFANEYTPDGESSAVNEETSNDSIEQTNTDSSSSNEDVYYANCTAVRDAGASPIYKGDPGYSSKLDRDGDGVGCE